jgi:hypothetical protein
MNAAPQRRDNLPEAATNNLLRLRHISPLRLNSSSFMAAKMD